MAKTKEERLSEVWQEAMERSRDIQTALKEVREECLQDRRFVSIPGAMWEGQLAEQFENKPKFEINKVMKSLIRIYNDYRNNRITVDFTNKDGSGKDDLASVCDGLFRADYMDSDGEDAFDNAFDEGTAGGFGAWRLVAEYEDEYDEDNDYQRICFEPIHDADNSVFFVGSKKYDASDAKACFVIYSMTTADYMAEWSDDPASWTKEIDQSYFDWYSRDVVYLAEYYNVEEKMETIHIFKDVIGKEYEYSTEEVGEEGFIDDLMARGIVLDRKRRIKTRRVHKYILSGGGVLEDCGYIAGKNIPIIPFYGRRWFIDNIERCSGHVRLAKDPSRIKNMQISKLAELASLSSQEKPIFSPEQMLGHQEMWAQDNLKNFPFLLSNALKDKQGNVIQTGPIGYTKPPQIPPAMAGLISLSEQDLRDILGNDGGDEIRSNISGETVDKIQERLDMQSYIYIANFAKSMKRCGRVWLDMAKDLYTEKGRRMKAVAADGNASSVELMKPYEDKDGSKTRNDLTQATFDVNVSIGPTSASKKAATRQQLLGMKQSAVNDPETIAVIDSLLMMNMEGEGVEETRDYWRRKLLQIGAVEPTQEEQQEMKAAAENVPPDPNSEFLAAAAQKELAQAAKVTAEIEETQADTKLKEAKTVETLMNADIKSQEAFERASSMIDGRGETAAPNGESEGS